MKESFNMDVSELRRLRLARLSHGDNQADDSIRDPLAAHPQPPACSAPLTEGASTSVRVHDGDRRQATVQSQISVCSGSLSIVFAVADVLPFLQAVPSIVAASVPPVLGRNAGSAAVLPPTTPGLREPASSEVLFLDSPSTRPVTPEEIADTNAWRIGARTSSPLNESLPDFSLMLPASPVDSEGGRPISPLSDVDDPGEPQSSRAKNRKQQSSSSPAKLSKFESWSWGQSKMSLPSTSRRCASPPTAKTFAWTARKSSSSTARWPVSTKGTESSARGSAPKSCTWSKSPSFSQFHAGNDNGAGCSSSAFTQSSAGKVPKKMGRPRKVKSEDDYKLMCAICRSAATGKCSNTKCGHFFHESCLQQWLATPGQESRFPKVCPSCGMDFYPDDVNPIFF